MGSLTYNPGPGDPQEVTAYGKRFKAGEAVEVNDPLALAKARNNPWFEGGEDAQPEAEVVGGYQDANTGDEVRLVRRRRLPAYGTPDLGPQGPVPPSPATQGSTAAGDAPSTRPVPPANFEEVFGAPREQFVTGDYEGAPEYKGPEGTEGAPPRRGRPPKNERKGEE
jgi:hypothetical protein